MTDQHHTHLNELDVEALARQRADLMGPFSPPVQAEIGEPAEAVPEEWSTIVRFRGDPLGRKFGAGEIEPATILGHLAISLAVLERACAVSESRMSDGGKVTLWAPLSVVDAVRIRTRLEAIVEELAATFERQAMLDTSVHADNLPF